MDSIWRDTADTPAAVFTVIHGEIMKRLPSAFMPCVWSDEPPD